MQIYIYLISNLEMSTPVLVLIVLNILISYKGFSESHFFERYKFSVLALKQQQYFRLLSSGFLHVDTTHLIFNMFALYMFGDVVIQITGIIFFIAIYIISLLAGNYFTYINHKDELNYSAVGASGAVSGIVYSSILFFPEMQLVLIFFPIPIPGNVFGILYLLYTLFGMKSRRDKIGHTAHFGGAVSGFAITLLIFPSLIYTQSYLIILMLIPLIVYLIMKKSGNL